MEPGGGGGCRGVAATPKVKCATLYLSAFIISCYHLFKGPLILHNKYTLHIKIEIIMIFLF